MAKLKAIDLIQEVQDFPTEEFTGFPAAVVRTDKNDADFETTIQNKRIYVFTIFLFQEIESQGIKKARRIIEGVVDEVGNAFDQDQLLNDADMPSNESIIISFPALSEIYQDTKYVISELELKIVTSFSIS